MSHANRLYEIEQKSLYIEFSNKKIVEFDKYKTSLFRLISDYIHIYCNRISEFKNEPLKLNLDQESFENLVQMAFNDQFNDIVEPYEFMSK